MDYRRTLYVFHLVRANGSFENYPIIQKRNVCDTEGLEYFDVEFSNHVLRVIPATQVVHSSSTVLTQMGHNFFGHLVCYLTIDKANVLIKEVWQQRAI